MVLGVPLLEGVEVVSLSVVLMEEEEELLFLRGMVALDHRHLSDSFWLSLVLTFADSEDVVCTKVAVDPG